MVGDVAAHHRCVCYLAPNFGGAAVVRKIVLAAYRSPRKTMRVFWAGPLRNVSAQRTSSFAKETATGKEYDDRFILLAHMFNI